MTSRKRNTRGKRLNLGGQQSRVCWTRCHIAAWRKTAKVAFAVMLAVALTPAMWDSSPLPSKFCSYVAKSAAAGKAPHEHYRRSHIDSWPNYGGDDSDSVTIRHNGRSLEIFFPYGLSRPDVCTIIEKGPLVPLSD